MKKLLVAPFSLHKRMLELVEAETENAKSGLPAKIIAKMNALVDPAMIEALYRASQAGVEVKLIIRGVCCLRAGVPGLSDQIEVRSIIGRFLEHSRIFYFENACRPKVYIGSADWMPRNFFSRIETVFPVEDGVLRDRIINEVLALSLADNTKSRLLQSDGSYSRPVPEKGIEARASQQEFMDRSIELKKSTLDSTENDLSSPIKMKVRRKPTIQST